MKNEFIRVGVRKVRKSKLNLDFDLKGMRFGGVRYLNIFFRGCYVGFVLSMSSEGKLRLWRLFF